MEDLVLRKDEDLRTDATALILQPEAEEAAVNVPAPLSDAQKRDDELLSRHRYGAKLIRNGKISLQVLEAAVREQAVTGERIGQILVANGFISDRDRVEAILETSSERIAQENVSHARIPPVLLDEHSIIISAVTETTIYVSTMTDEYIVETLVKEYYPEKKVEFVAFLPSSMNDFIVKMRRTASFDDHSQSAETMLDRLLNQALTEGASDIHITPRRKSYTVMFRLLGVRKIMHEGPLDEYLTALAQIKDRGRMDLAEKRKPQDGGFQFEHNGKMIDIRVVSLPVAGGEICVLRVLDPDRVQPSLTDLGITRVDKWRKGFNQQHGLCLICGQTGSGKTTTLNASIKELDRFGKAIYTIEDPVEYRISYTGQISVNTSVGLNFATGLRALMRADPDVIVLGEVRDEDTARIAIKAADTGHLVIATLHTGTIVGAVSRLRDLGIDPRELRYLLRAVLVQTLVRVTCTDCGGKGCVSCRGTGYSSRTVVSECEYFPDMESVDRVIAGERSWPTIAEDAVDKFDVGMTDMKELTRVFGSTVEDLMAKKRAAAAERSAQDAEASSAVFSLIEGADGFVPENA
jgi:general secretion pathway protein E